MGLAHTGTARAALAAVAVTEFGGAATPRGCTCRSRDFDFLNLRLPLMSDKDLHTGGIPILPTDVT